MNTLNTAFEEELYFSYLRDPESVSPEWRNYFKKINGTAVYGVAAKNGSDTPSNGANGHAAPSEGLEPLSSVNSKIALNMQESLTVPTATSFRSIPVKALDENRRIINKYLHKVKRNKVSFSQVLLWAVVRALKKFPRMNDACVEENGHYYRQINDSVNMGVAIDVTRKDGNRILMVPCIKDAQKMHFSEFIDAVDALIQKGKNNKLSLDDLTGTTVSLTNPGMIGTSASVPRLMKGQGLIIATGSIDYPQEFAAVRPDALNGLAVSKVVTVTGTYDHRIIQGAESAEFLQYIHRLLIGEFQFYDQIFASLRIPFEPVRWAADNSSGKNGLLSQGDDIDKSAGVMQLINAYRVRGHLASNINPLGMESYSYPELDPSYYGLNIWDLDREFAAVDSWHSSTMPLRDVLELMRDTYCGSTGIEYMHIQDHIKKDWVKNRLESTRNAPDFTTQEKAAILSKLVDAEAFENFLHTKFIGHKRFSLEGAEATIVFLDTLINSAAESRLGSIFIGMAHRGRLNVLANNMNKDLVKIFNEFEGNVDESMMHGTGDVKYHLGFKTKVEKDANSLVLWLAPNPSHLELINPVINGMSRAYAEENDKGNFSKSLSVVIHGDGAFAGQGIVQETLNLSRLNGYKTNGTVHFIINNQIGFTTSPVDARSTTYASCVGKMSQVPILHVNGNDPEAVVQAARFAFEYRSMFNDDVIIDMICFRKYGHNEGDEPSYTQPLLYKKIRSLQPVRELYEAELIKTRALDEQAVGNIHKATADRLNAAFEARSNRTPVPMEGAIDPAETISNVDTTFTREGLIAITDAVTSYPEDFKANPKVVGGLKKRHEMIESAEPMIDWAMAEALAFGSLLSEGHNIRLSGEDSRRGTFSQRHAVLVDIESERSYIPLNSINAGQGKISIFDSPLSELAVVGFDYGFSVVAENTLTLWEAQFGDFVNMAQPIIDQFISSGEVKWNQTSNLVMLLPHGHDGQGPEHSSARLERFLQLAADNNMIIGNFTTPANYYHAIRRQMKLKRKKPMILMTPKSMLRHQMAVSSVADLADGKFEFIIDDAGVRDRTQVTRVLLCSGKIYYDLLEEKHKSGADNVAIVRIEQLYPLNKNLLSTIVNGYPNCNNYIWVQEEHKNQGAWHFIYEELASVLSFGKQLSYLGRNPSASTATGYAKVHNRDQENIIKAAIGS